jgi:probable rRNA maturation factor
VIIVNLQRKVSLELKPFREFAKQLPLELSEAANSDFAVAFVSDKRIKKLNAFFRGIDRPTDVLSFPFENASFNQIDSGNSETDTLSSNFNFDSEIFTKNQKRFLGDIVISAERAQIQAKQNKLTLENEIKQLILHGFLHLLGYDHEKDNGEMNALELKMRKKLKI